MLKRHIKIPAAVVVVLLAAAALTPWHRGERVTTLSPGITRRQFECEAVNYTAIALDLRVARLDLLWRRPGGSNYGTLVEATTAVEGQGRRAVFATNAGIFSRGRGPSGEPTPLGLHVEGGQTLIPLNTEDGVGNFFLKPNGIFWLDRDGPHVAATERYAPASPPILATQSGPLLVEAGRLHPAFRADSENRHVRSGVGVDPDGRVVFLLSDEPCTLHAFASCFRGKLGCQDALYLDGGISQFHFADRQEATSSETGVRFAGLFVASVPRPQEDPAVNR